MSYLNTKPLLYGLKQGIGINNMELVEGYPAKIADMLLQDKIDLGLVPVAILPKLKEYYIVTDFCIGANGPVGSVGLFSNVPVQQIEQVIMDYQSRTSVALGKLLLQHHWKVSPEEVQATTEFSERISGTTGGIVIGDRAFAQRKKSVYMYDLAEAWKDFTGLPFVFAAWVANKPLPASFIDQFNIANAFGLNHLDEVVAANNYPLYDLKHYFTHNISYHLTSEKRQGLEKFLSFLQR